MYMIRQEVDEHLKTAAMLCLSAAKELNYKRDVVTAITILTNILAADVEKEA